MHNYMRLFLLLQRVYILMFPFLCLYNYRMGKRKQDNQANANIGNIIMFNY